LVRAGCLLLCRRRFSNIVFTNEEIDLARVLLFQVAEGAGMANRE
jgi:hypothetical protein